MIPGTALFVYFGSSSRDLADILNGNIGPDLTWKIVFAVVGGIIIVVFFILMLFIGKRAMNKYLKQVEDERKQGTNDGVVIENETIDTTQQQPSTTV